MRRLKLITFRDKTQSVSAWARELQVNRKTLGNRLKTMSMDQALALPFGNSHKAQYTFRGKTQTVRAWAREYNLPVDYLYKRLRNGMSIKEALFTPKGIPKKIDLGVVALTPKEIAKNVGVSINTIYARKYRNWKPTEIACPQVQTEHEITFNGKTQNAKAWAKETGLAHTTICRRIRDGYSPEEVLTRPSQKGYRKLRQITANGKTQDIKAWAKETGIRIELIRERIVRGWPEQDAVTIPKGGSRKIHA